LIIIPALEWTCPGYLKHLLMYFVQRMPTSVTDAYNQGAFICIAHPATWSWGESTDIPKDIPQEVEGYELYNGHGLSAPSWCAEKWKGMVAGSDAHEVNKYCSVKVWVYAERNLASIEKALRQGNVCVGKKPNEPPKPPSFIHDVAVTKFRATSSTATIGQRAKLVVTIENEGGYQETLNLSIFDNTVNNRLISSQRFTLAPSKSRSQLIYWTPTEPAGIRHKLTAKVSVVRGETDVADNSLTISVLVFRK